MKKQLRIHHDNKTDCVIDFNKGKIVKDENDSQKSNKAWPFMRKVKNKVEKKFVTLR